MNAQAVPITVMIPVGPHPHNTRWLGDAIDSVCQQTVKPHDLLFIDNGGHLDQRLLVDMVRCTLPWETWVSPSPLGMAVSVNVGVAHALCDLVIYLNSDDRLLPRAVELAWAKWQEIQDPMGYYHFAVEYSNTSEVQHAVGGNMMVTKALWQLTGGFPIEGSVGAPDVCLVSAMLAAKGRLGKFYAVADEPLYWYRQHDATDTNFRKRSGLALAQAAVINAITDAASKGEYPWAR